MSPGAARPRIGRRGTTSEVAAAAADNDAAAAAQSFDAPHVPPTVVEPAPGAMRKFIVHEFGDPGTLKSSVSVELASGVFVVAVLFWCATSTISDPDAPADGLAECAEPLPVALTEFSTVEPDGPPENELPAIARYCVAALYVAVIAVPDAIPDAAYARASATRVFPFAACCTIDHVSPGPLSATDETCTDAFQSPMTRKIHDPDATVTLVVTVIVDDDAAEPAVGPTAACSSAHAIRSPSAAEGRKGRRPAARRAPHYTGP